MKVHIPDGVSKKEAFQYLRDNKEQILDMKKSVNKFCDVTSVDITALGKADPMYKAMRYLYENDEENGVLKRTIVGNTYLWLDTHDDVHGKNLFAKSIQERGGRVPHLRDHIFQLDARVGKIQSIREDDISWRALGIGKTGMTQALIVESNIMKRYNQDIYDSYKEDEVDQHSVGMRYVKVDLAVNDEDFGPEYKLWKEVIVDIGNRSKAEAQGYFFFVSEARLVELSAVLLGSNELTPTLGNKSLPPFGTKSKEPRVSTPLNVDKLIQNFKI